jgi:outer membrane protein TolC
MGAACAAPAREPLEADALAESLATRAAGASEIAAAIDLAGQVALPLECPSAAELADPATSAYWQARAYVWNPRVREARAALVAARSRAGVSGAPGPAELEVDDVGLGGGDSDAETDLALTFDVLGLVGVGRTAAARELADVSVLAAHQELESALWRARHDAERARLELAAARAALAALATLGAEADEDRERIEILARHGRVPRADLDWAWAMRAEVDFQSAMARLAQESAREELALVCGLTPDADALDAVGPGVLEERAREAARAEVSAAPGAVELLERVPELRAERLGYALAEARVRAAAAESWPAVQLGPQLAIRADEWIEGGLLEIELPRPGPARRALEAALAERTRARERVEEALLARLAEVERLRAEVADLGACVAHNAGPIDDASRAMWDAARARFGLGVAGLEDWSFALEHRIEPMLSRIETMALFAGLAIDLAEARGPVVAGDVLARADAEGAEGAEGAGAAGGTR